MMIKKMLYGYGNPIYGRTMEWGRLTSTPILFKFSKGRERMNMEKVCTVGASGKLGRYMVQHALDRGNELNIRVSTRYPTGNRTVQAISDNYLAGMA